MDAPVFDLQKQAEQVVCSARGDLFRGLRIPVATVLGMLADGVAEVEILALYPDLEPEDIHEAQCYADKKRGGSRRRRPNEAGDNDSLYQAALAVEQDEALAAEMKEWETATIGDGIWREAPDRKSR